MWVWRTWLYSCRISSFPVVRAPMNRTEEVSRIRIDMVHYCFVLYMFSGTAGRVQVWHTTFKWCDFRFRKPALHCV